MPIPNVYFTSKNTVLGTPVDYDHADLPKLGGGGSKQNPPPVPGTGTPITGEPILFNDDGTRFLNTGNQSEIKNIFIYHDHTDVLYECSLYLRPFSEINYTTNPYDQWGKALRPDWTTPNDTIAPVFVDYGNADDTTTSWASLQDAGTNLFTQTHPTSPPYSNAGHPHPTVDLTTIGVGSITDTHREEGAKRDWAEVIKWAEDSVQDVGELETPSSDPSYGLFVNFDASVTTANLADNTALGSWRQFRSPFIDTPGVSPVGQSGTSQSSGFLLENSPSETIQALNFTAAANTSVGSYSTGTQNGCDLTRGTSQINVAYDPSTRNPRTPTNGVFRMDLILRVPSSEEFTGYREWDLVLQFTYA